jgi:WD domain, G-beta repeat
MVATVDVGKRDTKIHLWEVASCKEIGQLSGHRATVRAIAFSPDGRTLASGSDDLTCLVWDVTPFRDRLKLMPAPSPDTQTLAKERLEAAWADLAKDPAQAYAAVRTLQGVPAQAILLLRERIRPVAPLADPKQLKHWIADLDDNSFTVRDKAQREIGKLGELAVPALQQALKGQPALELKRRLQDLLAEVEPKLVGGSPQRLRELRAVQVLESIGTTEARQVLQALAKGVPGASLTRDAEAALTRLAKRSAAKP